MKNEERLRNIMQYIIKAPSTLNADVKLPASKSIGNRALVINALAGGTAMPDNLSDCDDTDVMIRALRDMPYEIDIKAAGTAMRFMTAYLAATPGKHVITGTERMRHRPIAILVDALRSLGAHIEYVDEEGYPPLRIEGRRLYGRQLDIPGNVSSQYISALLMIAPTLTSDLELRLTGEIFSRPYIDLTLWMMKEYGAVAEWKDIDTILVKAQPYVSRPYYIENDWSAASYWYEMMAVSGGEYDEVVLEGLNDGIKQGDSMSRYIFSLLGVKTTFEPSSLPGMQRVRLRNKGHCVPRLEYDFVNAPDLAQTFVVTCLALNVPFVFSGLKTLKIKETDRIEALKTEARKLGYVLHDVDNSQLIWDGERCEPQQNVAIDTYEDHRMALAFAPLSFVMPEIRINAPHVVTKSYPHYWTDLRSAGFEITEG